MLANSTCNRYCSAVGYTTTSLEAGKWYLIGSNFQNTDGTSINIQNLVQGLTPGSDAYDSPTIQYWDGSALQTICYFDFVWSDKVEDFVCAWADLYTGDYVDFDAAPGFGCWIQVPVDAVITCAGQVVGAESTSITITANWQLVSNPYPVTLDFNDSSVMDCTELEPGSDAYDSPTIQYWDGSALQTLCYFDFVWSDKAEDFVYAWADLYTGDYSAIALKPCTGFWILGPKGGAINFKK